MVMFCWIAKSWRSLMRSGRSLTVTAPPAPRVSVSIVEFGSCLRSAFAALVASSPLRSVMRTVSVPSFATPVNGMRSFRSSSR